MYVNACSLSGGTCVALTDSYDCAVNVTLFKMTTAKLKSLPLPPHSVFYIHYASRRKSYNGYASL